MGGKTADRAYGSIASLSAGPSARWRERFNGVNLFHLRTEQTARDRV